MGTILLKLAGPLQSWGADSRFTERRTRHEPTKSGVIGLLAAACGRRREDPIDDMAAYGMAVRIDQQGRFERDFQTARMRKFDATRQAWLSDASLPLSQRYYLADAVFVVAIEVPDHELASLSDALLHPRFPLYLGRRSCPPSEKVLLAAEEGLDMMSALKMWPWEAGSRRLQRQFQRDEFVSLEVVRDELPEDEGMSSEQVRDVPLSFSQEHRQYGWRDVVHDSVIVANPHYSAVKMPPHDPFSALEEV